MGDPNSNDSSMVHGTATETVFEGYEIFLGGNEMVTGCEAIISDKMGHAAETVLDYKMVDIHDNKMVHRNEIVPSGSKIDRNGQTVLRRCSQIVRGNEIGNDNVTTEVKPPTSSKRKRKTSMVWEHFTTEDSEGCTRACCNHCKRIFAYSSGLKMSGTSHLKRHITQGHCPEIEVQKPTAGGRENDCQGTVQKPSMRCRSTCTGYANAPFNPDRCQSYLAKMIILHGYPLQIVQQAAFISFVESLQPSFKVINKDAVEAEVYAVYLKERKSLLKQVENIPGRINLTVQTWTTSQTLGYVSLAGQFIDSEWKLHRRMLNFMMVPWSCSEDDAVTEAISRSLHQWNMSDKLFTITRDYESSSHDIYSLNLREELSKNNITMLGGQFSVVRCYAHMLTAVAIDVTALVQSVIYKIRESIKFIKCRIGHEEMFADIILQLQIPSNQILCLDIKTQWNTTYLMLQAALDYKEAFTMLEKCDGNYSQAPSAVDWEKVEVACRYLKLLYDSANNIMAVENPTANIFFHDAWTIQREISNATDHQDPNSVSSSIAKGVHETFGKYWKDCNVVLAIAVVMDPRFKMKIVEFSYSKIYGPTKGAKYVKLVDGVVHELYKEYVTQTLPLMPNHVGDKNIPRDPTSIGNLQSGFEVSIVKSELDQYLEEALVPRILEFDILNWWKLNAVRYPTLSRMARDVLAIPVSTVGRGSSVFAAGTEAKMLDDYQSSLHPETLEALFCAKDWLRHSSPAP
ncbi:zinc finger BED domain-containing protein RICESLEEPER 1 [Zea mays]|nr:zinc finger BED domain-containing protein RICESLEEPER 1 [Zea mays]|eukprot:XP_020401589.1 zinc finger BED domain-containing protein RICESLEEPER 1 [Zea mays]